MTPTNIKALMNSRALDVTPLLGVPVIFDPAKLVIPLGEARVVCKRTYHEEGTTWICIVEKLDGRVTATGFLSEAGAIAWGAARTARPEMVQVVPE